MHLLRVNIQYILTYLHNMIHLEPLTASAPHLLLLFLDLQSSWYWKSAMTHFDVRFGISYQIYLVNIIAHVLIHRHLSDHLFRPHNSRHPLLPLSVTQIWQPGQSGRSRHVLSSSIPLSLTTLVYTIFWQWINWFWCKLTQVVPPPCLHLAISEMWCWSGGRGIQRKLSLSCSIVYYYNGAQGYEQFLEVGRLYQALILLGSALYLPSASVSSVFMVLYGGVV